MFQRQAIFDFGKTRRPELISTNTDDFKTCLVNCRVLQTYRHNAVKAWAHLTGRQLADVEVVSTRLSVFDVQVNELDHQSVGWHGRLQTINAREMNKTGNFIKSLEMTAPSRSGWSTKRQSSKVSLWGQQQKWPCQIFSPAQYFLLRLAGGSQPP